MLGAELLSLPEPAAFRDSHGVIMAAAAKEFQAMLRSPDASVGQAEHMVYAWRREMGVARHKSKMARHKLDHDGGTMMKPRRAVKE